ncbi:MAG TPA: hypothetical protein VMM55_07945 [Thermohalobaculum sp.]|nr:hypothetical protein [Thermohalobaculum sp.]
MLRVELACEARGVGSPCNVVRDRRIESRLAKARRELAANLFAPKVDVMQMDRRRVGRLRPPMFLHGAAETS